ncbi:MAG: transcriptional activator RfaH [Rhodospirillaceae bacterium]|jgi:transcriptional antiterminator RfaH|nr:transcriptional activator RfaH [Rhodospirillales bacterium]MBT3906177.1 transcriptional activator RfaH [Rhodospirillaceae bacterium]MBT4700743.1 transcriptional activator RfaH [Rhodospirillaceae bacterium]MBT6220390.1 transcriptional activator RfaH [Rhodospirillaceae bacterium]MBT6361363.1 transcriptional activator RfaH [Rhodospirillaceae bacterium]
MQQWHAVYTHAKGEQKALFHLIRQGFEAYLPRYAKQRRHARRIDMVSAPLFPRYLFVYFDAESTPWRAINSTVGVIGLVGHDGPPTPMPEGIIEEIKSRENDTGLVKLFTADRFKRGDSVQVTTGAFSDQIGIFDCADDRERIFVLLQLMGREVRVHLPAEAIADCA